jgi:hypothetical protein
MGEYLFMKFDVVLMYVSLLYLIVFIKCRGWFDTSFKGGAKQHMAVNQILGNLFRLNWPRFVTHPVIGEEVPCLS